MTATPISPASPLPATAEPAASATGPARPVPPAAAGDAELDRLLAGRHHDPHSVLGAHPSPGGVAVRVLRPGARAVTVRTAHGAYALTHQRAGLFTGLLPARATAPRYRLRVDRGDADRTVEDDGYTFAPTVSDFDLHLIGEGRHEQLWHVLGAHTRVLDGVAGTSFAVWAPNAAGVRLIGDLNGWDGTAHPMRSLGRSGVWELFVPGAGDGMRYQYEIAARDGRTLRKADPLARRAEPPPGTASVVHTSRHVWRDQEWTGRHDRPPAHRAPMSVYEVHVPSWRPGATYRELAAELPPYVAGLGFTHVEFLPLMAHPFGGSWGYQVTGYYAPAAQLGGPDDLKALIDACHRAGLAVILDWVPAHFPKDDFALGRFDGTALYEPADPLRAEQPDWGTYQFDYGRPEVRNFLIANALYWAEEFHADGLRVDAVASMLYLDYSRPPGRWSPNGEGGQENWDAVAFFQELNATLYRRSPGIVTIAEESTAWDGVTRPTHAVVAGRGGLGFGLKWNMGWMHDVLDHLHREPVHRRWHHHELTFAMVYAYSENYLLPLSHDEVVHGKGSLVSRFPGDWWQQRATLRALLGFMWAHPGKQLLFMGQEFAQGAEWDHDAGPQWWVLADDWPGHAGHRGVQDLVRDLNHRYTAAPALWRLDADPAGFGWLAADAAEDNTLAFVRSAPGGPPLVSVGNFSPVVRHGYRIGVPRPGRWRVVLDTDAEEYGGSGARPPGPLDSEPVAWHGRPDSVTLTLPPLATVWLMPEPPEDAGGDARR